MFKYNLKHTDRMKKTKYSMFLSLNDHYNHFGVFFLIVFPMLEFEVFLNSFTYMT